MAEETVTTASSRPQARRTAIAAAAEEFIAHGYPGTSMDQIAARSGASKQTVYKRELFEQFPHDRLHSAGEAAEADALRLRGSAELAADLRTSHGGSWTG